MSQKHFDKVWINNLSTPTTPLLTLTITINEEDYKKNPLHIVQRHQEDQSRHEIVLSFLTPEDLGKLESAIQIAKQTKLDNDAMMKLWHEVNDDTSVYGVGIYRKGEGFGMLYGPNPDIKDMLKAYPKVLLNTKDYNQYDIYVIKFEKGEDQDPISTELYIWNKTDEAWQEI